MAICIACEGLGVTCDGHVCRCGAHRRPLPTAVGCLCDVIGRNEKLGASVLLIQLCPHCESRHYYEATAPGKYPCPRTGGRFEVTVVY